MHVRIGARNVAISVVIEAIVEDIVEDIVEAIDVRENRVEVIYK